jgi:hypothetical protein
VQRGGFWIPTSPTPAQTIEGTYSGSAIGAGNLTNFLLTATVSSGVISGTLRAPEGTGQIPLSGTASASGEVTMTATDDCGAARYTLTGSITFDASGMARIAGTWSQPAVAGCPGASGTFTMSRGAAGPTSNTFPSGTWVGTLSRPVGDPVTVTWVATRGPAPNASSSGSFDGPLTLTYGGRSVTARLFGFLGGSNTAVMGGYRFNFQIEVEPGASPAVPNCRIFSFVGEGPNNLRDASTTITAPFEIQYSSCHGFIDPTPPPGCSSPTCTPSSQRESTQLVLNKQ